MIDFMHLMHFKDGTTRSQFLWNTFQTFNSFNLFDIIASIPQGEIDSRKVCWSKNQTLPKHQHVICLNCFNVFIKHLNNGPWTHFSILQHNLLLTKQIHTTLQTTLFSYVESLYSELEKQAALKVLGKRNHWKAWWIQEAWTYHHIP